jgi:hypothetical protein
MAKFLCVLTLLFTIISCNKASDCSKDAIDKERESKGYKLAEVCANAGHIEAMTQLGIYYESGKNEVAQDYNNAMSWYEKAEEKGDIDAMIHIAQLYAGEHHYSDKESPFKDYDKAISWYRRAANMGSTYAITKLGRIYIDNKIVPINYSESFKWFSRGADLGDTQATYYLGLAYMYGEGVAQDYNKAAKLLKKASEHFIYTGTYERLIETNPEFIGLRIRNTTIDDLKNIFSSVHKLKPQVYGDYIFGVFVIDPNNLPIQNVKSTLLLFHKDGFLECMQFVFFDDIKSKKFFELRNMLDKKYNKLGSDEFKSGFKYALYEYGGSIIELNSNTNPSKAVLTLRSRFFNLLY